MDQTAYYEVTEKDFEPSEAQGWNDFDDYHFQQFEENRIKAINYLFQKCQWSEDFTWMRRPHRWFYFIKTFICLCLNLRGAHFNDISILFFDETPIYGECGGYDWTILEVGEGIFENWYISIYSDGT